MKRLIIVLIITFCSAGLLVAQTYEDALKFSQNMYEGTARFQGMGGAFAALGGDFTTLSINPAGAGVYRMSEITITSTVAIAATSTDYMNQTIKERKGKFGLGNFGYIGVYGSDAAKGLVGFNFGVGFNKLQNNTQRFAAVGTNAQNSYAQAIARGMRGMDYHGIEDWATSTEWIAYETFLVDTMPGYTDRYLGATENLDRQLMGPVKQSFYRDQSGYVGEYVLNFGMNFSNKFYLGMTLGIQDIDNDLYEEYDERAVNPNDFLEVPVAGSFRNLTHTMERYTNGVGYNLKFGAIYRPIDGLRLGAYIHTPTWMYLTETWYENMYSTFSRGKYNSGEQGVYDYRVNAPFKWGAGAAYTFGNMGLISVDYEGANYGSLSMFSRNHNVDWDNMNKDDLNKYCRAVTTNIRIGGELRVDEIAVRGGYSFYQNPEKDKPSTHIGSVGLGYRTQYFFADLAYSFSPSVKADYYFADNPVMATNSFYSKILLTLGIRF